MSKTAPKPEPDLPPEESNLEHSQHLMGLLINMIEVDHGLKPFCVKTHKIGSEFPVARYGDFKGRYCSFSIMGSHIVATTLSMSDNKVLVDGCIRMKIDPDDKWRVIIVETLKLTKLI